MSLLKIFLGNVCSKENVTSQNAIRDNLNYPTILDETRTGRGIQTFHSKVLPFFQAGDFRGVEMSYMFYPKYGRRYRQVKRNLEIETPTTDMLDGYLVSWRNHFKGDYGYNIPNLPAKILTSNLKNKKKNAKVRGRFG